MGEGENGRMGEHEAPGNNVNKITSIIIIIITV
jgi:hypothetical protein